MTPPLPIEHLSQLALFPLPNCVLLPGSILPLHIFEERYREMTRDVLAGSGFIAIARLKPGYEADYENSPPIHMCCGVGRIIASEELPDGRYHLLVRGLARVEVEEELPLHRPYRTARVHLLADDMANIDPHSMARAHRQLIAVCDRLALSLERGGEELRELVRIDTCPSACADAVVSALLRDADARQAHLETYSPLLRLQRAVDCVGNILCEMCPTTDMPN